MNDASPSKSLAYSHWLHLCDFSPVCDSICREEIADLTMEDIALAIAMESLEDIDGWVLHSRKSDFCLS